MIRRIGPVSISWDESGSSPCDEGADWPIRALSASQASAKLGADGASWFNQASWSGIEAHAWSAWISNRSRDAAIWNDAFPGAFREALSVVIPAVLRREGLFDGHGAIVAPDPARPDDGVFISGLSGSGKSTFTISAAQGGARFVSDDSVAIGPDPAGLRGWSRRSSISLDASLYPRLLAAVPSRHIDGKVWFNGRDVFGPLFVDSLSVRALLFLVPADGARGRDAVSSTPARITPADAYKRLLMAHPILTLDRGARNCFGVVRALASLPAYFMTSGEDLIRSPTWACSVLTSLLEVAPVPAATAI